MITKITLPFEHSKCSVNGCNCSNFGLIGVSTWDNKLYAYEKADGLLNFWSVHALIPSSWEKSHQIEIPEFHVWKTAFNEDSTKIGCILDLGELNAVSATFILVDIHEKTPQKSTPNFEVLVQANNLTTLHDFGFTKLGWTIISEAESAPGQLLIYSLESNMELKYFATINAKNAHSTAFTSEKIYCFGRIAVHGVWRQHLTVFDLETKNTVSISLGQQAQPNSNKLQLISNQSEAFLVLYNPVSRRFELGSIRSDGQKIKLKKLCSMDVWPPTSSICSSQDRLFVANIEQKCLTGISFMLPKLQDICMYKVQCLAEKSDGQLKTGIEVAALGKLVGALRL